MHAPKEWLPFHPDYYLDRRRAEWLAEERLGWVRYQTCATHPVVFVHQGQAAHIADALDVGLHARQCDALASAAVLSGGSQGAPLVADSIDIADSITKEEAGET